MRHLIRRFVMITSLMCLLSLFVVPHKDPPSTFQRTPTTVLSEAQVEETEFQCLTEAIYYEAGNQNFEGQKAVAFVVFHRTRLFRKSVCDVVYQPKQFSWVAYKDKIKIDPNNWNKCSRLAKYMLMYPWVYRDNTGGAISFDNKIHSEWTSLEPTVRIGAHYFYRLRS